MLKNLFRKKPPKVVEESTDTDSVGTCHGCRYLEGTMSKYKFYAGCGNGIWGGDRIVSLGDIVYRPEECTEIHERD